MRDIFETAKIRDLIFMYSGVFAINGCKECIGKLTQYEKNIPVTIQKTDDFTSMVVGLLFNNSL